jgi:drug/metabolite transporter (DMT)-like permease
MVAILLALASSLGYGGADFAGGLASRDAHVFRVVAAAAPAGLLVNLLLLPVLGADWSASAVAWGAGSGLASAAAFTLLYQTLALGPMSILSPLTAVISAVIPVGVGILEGERLGAPAFAGLLLAMLAIILVGVVPPRRRAGPADGRWSSRSARAVRSPPSSSVCTRLRQGAVSPLCSRGASSPRASCWVPS